MPRQLVLAAAAAVRGGAAARAAEPPVTQHDELSKCDLTWMAGYKNAQIPSMLHKDIKAQHHTCTADVHGDIYWLADTPDRVRTWLSWRSPSG